MPVIRSADIAVHRVHGSTFSSFVAPSRGSTQLCAWQLTVPAGLTGAAHRPTREEVLLLLDGELTITLDGTATDLAAGDVVLVPAGSELRVDGGTSDATAWVTTTPGLEAIMADGSAANVAGAAPVNSTKLCIRLAHPGQADQRHRT